MANGSLEKRHSPAAKLLRELPQALAYERGAGHTRRAEWRVILRMIVVLHDSGAFAWSPRKASLLWASDAGSVSRKLTQPRLSAAVGL
jgi:hypothetical protein